ncbi:MAG: sugar transporter, partial [Candidatus Aminicenantales bacterium]
MKKATTLIALLSLLTASGLAQILPQTQTPAQTQAARDQFVRAYRIGPGDLLEISVFEVAELSQT